MPLKLRGMIDYILTFDKNAVFLCTPEDGGEPYYVTAVGANGILTIRNRRTGSFSPFKLKRDDKSTYELVNQKNYPKWLFEDEDKYYTAQEVREMFKENDKLIFGVFLDGAYVNADVVYCDGSICVNDYTHKYNHIFSFAAFESNPAFKYKQWYV